MNGWEESLEQWRLTQIEKRHARRKRVAAIAIIVAAILFAMLPLLCQASEREVIAIAAARVKWGMSLRPTMPDKPPQVRNKNLVLGNPWVETATGTTSDKHLIEAHGFTAAQLKGLTQDQKNRLHGAAHEAPRAAVSNCPNGQCPLPTRRGRR